MLYVIVGKYAGLAQKYSQFTTLVWPRDQLEAGGVGFSLSLSLSNVMRMLQTGKKIWRICKGEIFVWIKPDWYGLFSMRLCMAMASY